MSDRRFKKIKDNVYTAKENFVKKATEFYVAVAVDRDGSEGIIAQIDLGRFPPVEKAMMCASIEDRDAIMKAAEQASKDAVMEIRVLKYTKVEVYAVFKPMKLN